MGEIKVGCGAPHHVGCGVQNNIIQLNNGLWYNGITHASGACNPGSIPGSPTNNNNQYSMKILVAYYSLTGNTDFIARAIQEATGADILRLRPRKEIPKNFLRLIWGGRQVMTGKKPPLEPFDKNLNDYDLIFLGTPVWVETFTPPLRTFFETNRLAGKKVALFCTYGGGEGKSLKDIKEILTAAEIVGEIGFKEPLKNDSAECASQAKKWAEKIIAQASS